MQRAQHHTTNLKGKRENSRRQKRKSRLDQQENIGYDLKTHKSLTITLRVTKIIPKRWREAQRFFGTEKSYSEKVQMSAYEQPKHHDWSMSNTQCGTYSRGNVPVRGCIGLLLILNSKHNTATDHRWARLHSKTLPAKKTALLQVV